MAWAQKRVEEWNRSNPRDPLQLSIQKISDRLLDDMQRTGYCGDFINDIDFQQIYQHTNAMAVLLHRKRRMVAFAVYDDTSLGMAEILALCAESPRQQAQASARTNGPILAHLGSFVFLATLEALVASTKRIVIRQSAHANRTATHLFTRYGFQRGVEENGATTWERAPITARALLEYTADFAGPTRLRPEQVIQNDQPFAQPEPLLVGVDEMGSVSDLPPGIVLVQPSNHVPAIPEHPRPRSRRSSPAAPFQIGRRTPIRSAGSSPNPFSIGPPGTPVSPSQQVVWEANQGPGIVSNASAALGGNIMDIPVASPQARVQPARAAEHPPQGKYYCGNNPKGDDWRKQEEDGHIMRIYKIAKEDKSGYEEYPDVALREAGTLWQCYKSGFHSAFGHPRNR